MREARDAGMIVLAAGLLLLASPLRMLWQRDAAHWWLPFALWAGVIALGALAARREGA